MSLSFKPRLESLDERLVPDGEPLQPFPHFAIDSVQGRTINLSYASDANASMFSLGNKGVNPDAFHVVTQEHTGGTALKTVSITVPNEYDGLLPLVMRTQSGGPIEQQMSFLVDAGGSVTPYGQTVPLGQEEAFARRHPEVSLPSLLSATLNGNKIDVHVRTPKNSGYLVLSKTETGHPSVDSPAPQVALLTTPGGTADTTFALGAPQNNATYWIRFQDMPYGSDVATPIKVVKNGETITVVDSAPLPVIILPDDSEDAPPEEQLAAIAQRKAAITEALRVETITVTPRVSASVSGKMLTVDFADFPAGPYAFEMMELQNGQPTGGAGLYEWVIVYPPAGGTGRVTKDLTSGMQSWYTDRQVQMLIYKRDTDVVMSDRTVATLKKDGTMINFPAAGLQASMPSLAQTITIKSPTPEQVTTLTAEMATLLQREAVLQTLTGLLETYQQNALAILNAAEGGDTKTLLLVPHIDLGTVRVNENESLLSYDASDFPAGTRLKIIRADSPASSTPFVDIELPENGTGTVGFNVDGASTATRIILVDPQGRVFETGSRPWILGKKFTSEPADTVDVRAWAYWEEGEWTDEEATALKARASAMGFEQTESANVMDVTPAIQVIAFDPAHGRQAKLNYFGLPEGAIVQLWKTDHGSAPMTLVSEIPVGQHQGSLSFGGNLENSWYRVTVVVGAEKRSIGLVSDFAPPQSQEPLGFTHFKVAESAAEKHSVPTVSVQQQLWLGTLERNTYNNVTTDFGEIAAGKMWEKLTGPWSSSITHHTVLVTFENLLRERMGLPVTPGFVYDPGLRSAIEVQFNALNAIYLEQSRATTQYFLDMAQRERDAWVAHDAERAANVQYASRADILAVYKKLGRLPPKEMIEQWHSENNTIESEQNELLGYENDPNAEGMGGDPKTGLYPVELRNFDSESPLKIFNDIANLYIDTSPNSPVQINGNYIRKDSIAGKAFLGLYQNLLSLPREERILLSKKIAYVFGVQWGKIYSITQLENFAKFRANLEIVFRQYGYSDIFSSNAPSPIDWTKQLPTSTDKLSYTNGNIRVRWDFPLGMNISQSDIHHVDIFLYHALSPDIKIISTPVGTNRGRFLYVDIPVETINTIPNIGDLGPQLCTIKTVIWLNNVTNGVHDSLKGETDAFSMDWDGQVTPINQITSGEFSKNPTENAILNQLRSPVSGEGWSNTGGSPYHYGRSLLALDLNAPHDRGAEIRSGAVGIIESINLSNGFVTMRHEPVDGKPWETRYFHMTDILVDITKENYQGEEEATFDLLKKYKDKAVEILRNQGTSETELSTLINGYLRTKDNNGQLLALTAGNKLRTTITSLPEFLQELSSANSRRAAAQSIINNLVSQWKTENKSWPAGTLLGKGGNEGPSTGPHLHFEVVLHGAPVSLYDWANSNIHSGINTKVFITDLISKDFVWEDTKNALLNQEDKVALIRKDIIQSNGSVKSSENTYYAVGPNFNFLNLENEQKLFWDVTRGCWIKFGVVNPTEKWENGNWKSL